MNWDIRCKVRCDIIAYSGVNLSGARAHARLHAAGGLQGDEIDGNRLASLAVLGPLGLRITMMTSTQDNWEDFTWRTVSLLPGRVYVTKQGQIGIRVPDLDALDEPDSRRSDPDFMASYPLAASLEKGAGWTFGRVADVQLKNRVRGVRVEWFDPKG